MYSEWIALVFVSREFIYLETEPCLHTHTVLYPLFYMGKLGIFTCFEGLGKGEH